ncbi:MAG: ribbon-helix-helix domain-containing protein [Anaerolineae bacterium]|jgi:hypothetical protein|nr:ribbon-helix-helix domain-containing protein [Anaerolineae bacterium]MDH7473159.1 CopG family transcriptional regulator [Anaerolineae bacterium]
MSDNPIEYVTTNIRLPKAMHRELKRRALEKNTSVSALIRESVTTYLVREGAVQRADETLPSSDPIFQLGTLATESDIVGSEVGDGSVQHDYYVYQREHERWHAEDNAQ